MSAQRSLMFSWCFPAMGTICNNRNACLTAHLLRFDAVSPTGCRCSIMSAFVSQLGIVPAAEYLGWRLISGSIQLVPGRQTDACLTDRRVGGVENTLCCLGQAQGTQAVQRQPGLQHSASHKAAIPPKKRGRIQRNRDVREAHLGMQTWRHPDRVSRSRRSSLSPFLPTLETPREARSWMYCRR